MGSLACPLPAVHCCVALPTSTCCFPVPSGRANLISTKERGNLHLTGKLLTCARARKLLTQRCSGIHRICCAAAAADGAERSQSVVLLEPGFLVPEEHRPQAADFSRSMGADSQAVPVIDISGLFSGDPLERRVTVEAIHQACKDVGFFQVVNHGVPDSVVDDMVKTMKAFFQLPLHVKARVARSTSNSRGYYNDELTKQTRDWKEGFDFGAVPCPEMPHDAAENRVQDGWNQWPHEQADFRQAQWTYFTTVASLAHTLVRTLAEGLTGDPAAFERAFPGGEHTSFQRLNFYDRCPAPLEVLGINRHSDAAALTVLWQGDVAGLQVLRDGQWYTVEPRPGAFVINVGDMVQVMSNDAYHAPLHRVLVHEDRERFSCPLFYSPAYAATMEPLPALLEATGSSAAYRPFSWGEFRRRRVEGDLQDVGEEVQISQFRV